MCKYVNEKEQDIGSTHGVVSEEELHEGVIQ